MILLFAVPQWPRWRPRFARRLLWPTILVAVLFLAWGSQHLVYQTIWFSLRPLVPLLVVVGSVGLAAGGARRRLDSGSRQVLFLLLAVVATFGIVQFPYSRAVYFCYIAPLVVLAYLAVCRRQPRAAPRRLHLVVLGFHLVFAMVWLNLGWVETMENRFVHMPFDTSLDAEAGLGRASLRVTAQSAALHGHLVRAIHAHAAPGDAIFAGPDCPEVYFLADRRNVTPTLLDFLDRDFGTPAHAARILATLDREHIDVVVLRRQRIFTPLDQELIRAVEARYPGKTMLPPYSIHWR
jgi:hypothetical protein